MSFYVQEPVKRTNKIGFRDSLSHLPRKRTNNVKKEDACPESWERGQTSVKIGDACPLVQKINQLKNNEQLLLN